MLLTTLFYLPAMVHLQCKYRRVGNGKTSMKIWRQKHVRTMSTTISRDTWVIYDNLNGMCNTLLMQCCQVHRPKMGKKNYNKLSIPYGTVAIATSTTKDQTLFSAYTFQVSFACPGNHGSPGWRHCFVSGTGTIGPKKRRHRSSIMVTSIAAPRASMATLGKSHGSPGFSSILHILSE